MGETPPRQEPQERGVETSSLRKGIIGIIASYPPGDYRGKVLLWAGFYNLIKSEIGVLTFSQVFPDLIDQCLTFRQREGFYKRILSGYLKGWPGGEDITCLLVRALLANTNWRVQREVLVRLIGTIGHDEEKVVRVWNWLVEYTEGKDYAALPATKGSE